MNGNDTQSFLAEKMNQHPLDSKKFISAGIGLMAVMIVWLGTIVCMFVKTDTASHFVSLATIVVSFIGAITTTILTGQAVFEYKAMATIQTVDTNTKQETISKNNITNTTNCDESIIEDDGSKLKPFSQPATHEKGFDK